MATSLTRIRLEIIDVPSPCPADWSAMKAVDGERVRFCRHCDKHVYNLSAMSREAAEQLMADQTNAEHFCVRLYKRADGTVVTADCGGRWRAGAMRWAKRWGGPVGVAVSFALSIVGCNESPRPEPTDRVLSGVVVQTVDVQGEPKVPTTQHVDAERPVK